MKTTKFLLSAFAALMLASCSSNGRKVESLNRVFEYGALENVVWMPDREAWIDITSSKTEDDEYEMALKVTLPLEIEMAVPAFKDLTVDDLKDEHREMAATTISFYNNKDMERLIWALDLELEQNQFDDFLKFLQGGVGTTGKFTFVSTYSVSDKEDVEKYKERINEVGFIEPIALSIGVKDNKTWKVISESMSVEEEKTKSPMGHYIINVEDLVAKTELLTKLAQNGPSKSLSEAVLENGKDFIDAIKTADIYKDDMTPEQQKRYANLMENIKKQAEQAGETMNQVNDIVEEVVVDDDEEEEE